MPYSLDKEVSQDKGIAVNRNAIATNASNIAGLDTRLTIAESTLADVDAHAIRDDITADQNMVGRLIITKDGNPFRLAHTTSSSYVEAHIANDLSQTLVLGSIGSTYGGVDWAGSTYVYNTGAKNMWIKSQQELGFFTGGTSLANKRVSINSSGDASFTGSITTTSSISSTKAQTNGVSWTNASMHIEPVQGTTNTTGRSTIVMGASTNTAGYGYSLNVHRTSTDASTPDFHINHHNASASGTERLRISPTLITLTGTTAVNGTLTATTLRAGDGTDGRFFSDTAGRTAFADGSFYIQDTVPVFYNYATTIYHGKTSGSAQLFRGNTLSGDSWSLTGPGVLSTTGLINANGGLAQDGHTIFNGTDTWLRTLGATGWYSATYGGGMYMTDANYVRVYNSKGFQVDKTGVGAILCAGGIRSKSTVIWTGNTNAAIDLDTYITSGLTSALLSVEWYVTSGTATGSVSNSTCSVHWKKNQLSWGAAFSVTTTTQDDYGVYINNANQLIVRRVQSASYTNMYLKSITVLQEYT
jgi:hypothetical protein